MPSAQTPRDAGGLSRRDLLKLAASLPFLEAGRQLAAKRMASTAAGRSGPPNILVLVFDTLSASNISLYGYPRRTTPELDRLSERATVFHSHRSAGNFTTPGTASLLTGVYPWSHRALHIQGTVLDEYRDRSLFALLAGRGYHRLAYTHNIVAASLLDQFRRDLETLPQVGDLALLDLTFAERLFPRDLTVAVHGEGVLTHRGDTPSGSLFLYHPLSLLGARLLRRSDDRHRERFPRGLPGAHDLRFLLEDAIDWTIEQLSAIPRPFFAYLHFLPPHDPYNPRHEFVGIFDDRPDPLPKPPHPLSDRVPTQFLNSARRRYDETIAYVDAELGRLFRFLTSSGLLDTTYVILTSDHGEMFERGIWNHITPVLFDPVVRVPLVVWEPGQQVGRNVHTPTSSVDILPTVLRIADVPIPDRCEGQVLPSILGEPPTPDRSVYCVEAKGSPKLGALEVRSTAVISGRSKLVHYLGYQGYDGVYELYDLEEDPEELVDLYPKRPGITADLVEMLSTQQFRMGALP